jgi:hypothetical protein
MKPVIDISCSVIPFLLAPARTSPVPGRDNSFIHAQTLQLMEQNLNKGRPSIDNLNLVEYLHVLGIDPIATRPNETDYRSPFDDDSRAIMTVYHDSNRFVDIGSGLEGTLTEFACHLFGCSPEELCEDVVRYRLYMVGKHAVTGSNETQ